MGSGGAMERYLYEILTLKKKYCCVRSVDVAHHMKYTKPSVSAAVNRLIREGLLVMEEDGNLEVTERGAEYFRSDKERCDFFEPLLEAAGLDPDTAETEAFSLAKAIQPETFDALKKYLSDSFPVRQA